MQTLVIKDVKDEFIPSLKAFVKAIGAKLDKSKINKEEKEILKAIAQIDKDRKPGKLKTYDSADEAFRDAGLL